MLDKRLQQLVQEQCNMSRQSHNTPGPSLPQICINIHPDAVPPIHAESYHVATDKGPLQVPVYF